jgi:putative folate metabolism gamma-glutamate ligase
MNISVIHTHRITPKTTTANDIINRSISSFSEKSILVVTSKIVSICEGRVLQIGKKQKRDIIADEADYVLTGKDVRYGITLTRKHNILIPSSGIDESNGNGQYVLWPKHPQRSANDIRQHLCSRFSIQHAGVIITDSKTTPLRWGTTGIAIAHSGFMALKNYIGTPDIFGRTLKYTKASIVDGLAAAAVVAMGEGKEQTPMAVISDVPFVEFQTRNPTAKELTELAIDIHDDIYAPLLTSVTWKKSSKA